MFKDEFTRRRILALLATVPALLARGPFFASYASAEEADDDAALKKQFEFLSKNGNVECSAKFEAAIATMPADARLQGSCCAPMDEARYFQQIKGIRKYADISEVPPDPYDIPAGMAQKLMPYYNLRLNRTEKIAYDGAFRHAGSMLLQVLAVAHVWRPWQIPNPRAPIHRTTTRRSLEHRPRLWRTQRDDHALEP
jgi:hypothetical protein